MRKKAAIWLAVAAAFFIVGLVGCGADVPAPVDGSFEQSVSASGTVELPEQGGLSDVASYDTLYSDSYSIATPEQKVQLEGIPVIECCGSVGTYVREIMIIMGALPADTPRITYAEAVSICNEFEDTYASPGDIDAAFVMRFNEIAGAPDFHGGSGSVRRIYLLDEQGEEYIRISYGRVRYINEQTGENICIYPAEVERSERKAP